MQRNDAHLARRERPEERELEKKRAELAALEEQLIAAELELRTLRGELAGFEREYLRTVGVGLAQLDAIEAEIAALDAQRSPANSDAQQRAREARDTAEQSAGEVGAAQSATARNFNPSDELKRLYRQAAKQLHPDRTTDDAERRIRGEAMKAVNRAYEDGDEAAIEAILRGWGERPEAVQGEGVGAELVRVVRKIAQIENRLAAIDTELAQLRAGDLYALRNDALRSAKEGRDLVAVILSDTCGRIEEARRRLAELKAAG